MCLARLCHDGYEFCTLTCEDWQVRFHPFKNNNNNTKQREGVAVEGRVSQGRGRVAGPRNGTVALPPRRTMNHLEGGGGGEG